MPEKAQQIKELRDPSETCTQFVFGPDYRFIDDTHKEIASHGDWEKLNSINELQEGDVVFYGAPNLSLVSHVGVVGDDGKINSKFPNDPAIHKHSLWGEPIPNHVYFEACQVFRKIN